jgi:hypothetical protein
MKLALLSLLLLSTSAFARIGETVAQIEERLGKGTPAKSKSDEKEQAFSYTFKDIKVVVYFFEGTSSEETYSNVSEQDAFAILQKQCAGEWRQNGSRNGYVWYKGPNGQVASYHNESDTLDVHDAKLAQYRLLLAGRLREGRLEGL